MALANQITQALLKVSDRASKILLDNCVVLSSDIGLVRVSNQDRVALARIKHAESELPLFVLVLCDGMGGMVEGELCAALTAATFIESMAGGNFIQPLDKLLETAGRTANDYLYSYYGGRGGSTLSALAWQPGAGAAIINIGDSRIYQQKSGNVEELIRLTVDDNVKEAFGGVGNELIQFIGLGPGLKPHTRAIGSEGFIMLTTDGIHYIDHDLLRKIITGASTPKSKTERATAIARWLGGGDNATIAVVDLDAVPSDRYLAPNTLEVWPCGAESMSIWNLERPILAKRRSEVESDAATVEKNEPKTRKKKAASRRIKPADQQRLKIEIDVDEAENADRG